MKRKSAKQQEAADRQAEYDSLTAEQKLQRARARRGKSEREIRRLMKPRG